MWSKSITVLGVLFGFLAVAQAQTLPPSDIVNLAAEPADNAVVLTWDAAEDDGFVTGYRVYYGTSPVVEEDDAYEDDLYTNSNEPTYTMSNLLNGVDYYFSVTGIDDDQMESINYSNEATAVPAAEVTGDSEGPKVISAEHTKINEVTVVMSEPIAPTDASSFLLSHQSSFEEVEIQEILFNSENIIFTIELGILTPGDTYELTATSAVEDLAGNPVSSGITDTVAFEAQAEFRSEEVIVEPDPIELPPEPDPVVIDEPDPFQEIVDEDFGDIEDLLAEIDDEPIPDKSSAPDTTAPLEAQNLKANTDNVESSNQVSLAWEPALNLDNDVVDQVLYTRTGLGSWDEGYSVGAGTSETTLDVEPNQNYQVRLVTIDQSGNESEGAVFSFSTNLSKTGPGTVIALSAALILGVMMLLSRRRVA